MNHVLALFDPSTDKSLETFGVTVGGVAAAIYYIRELFRKNPAHPPNEQLDAVLRAMSERVQKSEAEIGNLWQTMWAEDTRIREQLSKAVGDFERTVGQLEGTLKQVGEINAAIFNKLLE